MKVIVMTMVCFMLSWSVQIAAKPAGSEQVIEVSYQISFAWQEKNHLFLPYYDTNGKRLFVFTPRHLAWAVYDEGGQLVTSGRASGGASYCADSGRPCKTPQGMYRILWKKGADCISTRYPLPDGGAKMPWCMFFSDKGYAIHGASPRNIPNWNASHGCIRIETPAAAWLHESFLDYRSQVMVLPY